MELNFGENIKRLRKSRDLTQEALADELGVSAQSVSKWECGYGYPDITQLPAIANFFGVSIDELLDNDKESQNKVYEFFRAQLSTFGEASEEKIEFIHDYCRRYPNLAMYHYILCSEISDYITRICPEQRNKYYPLLLQTAEKRINAASYRDFIATCMIKACPEEDLGKWSKYVSYSVKNIRRNRLIERYAALGETDQWQNNIYLSHLETIAIQLDIRFPDSAGAEAKAKYHRDILDTISSFGTDGQIPEGWLALYANKQLVYAACLFGMGKMDDGKREFCSAIEKLRRYFELKEEYLDTGSPLFGGLRVNKNWHFAIDEKGNEYKLYGTAPLFFSYGKAESILELLNNRRWAWFDSARNEDYYKDTIKWLEILTAE